MSRVVVRLDVLECYLTLASVRPIRCVSVQGDGESRDPLPFNLSPLVKLELLRGKNERAARPKTKRFVYAIN